VARVEGHAAVVERQVIQRVAARLGVSYQFVCEMLAAELDPD